MKMTRVAIPPGGVKTLRSLEREALDAEHAARVASDTAVQARARSDAVRVALCEALGAPEGAVTLDLKSGSFLIAGREDQPDTGPG